MLVRMMFISCLVCPQRTLTGGFEEAVSASSEIVLEPGDVLYLPRGFIHSAVTEGSQNSLHLTLSCHRANSWADLLEAALPNALSGGYCK